MSDRTLYSLLCGRVYKLNAITRNRYFNPQHHDAYYAMIWLVDEMSRETVMRPFEELEASLDKEELNHSLCILRSAGMQQGQDTMALPSKPLEGAVNASLDVKQAPGHLIVVVRL